MGSVGGAFLQAVGTKTQALEVEISDLKIMSLVTDTTPLILDNNRPLANPQILAQWKIIKPPAWNTPTNFRYVTGYRSVSGQIKRTVGTGSVIVGISSSDDDGTTWNPLTGISGNTTSFVATSDNDRAEQNITDLTDFGFLLYSSIDLATEGEVRGLAMIAPIVIPKDFVLSRVI